MPFIFPSIKKLAILIAFLAIAGICAHAQTAFVIDAETGLVFSGKNDIQIPGNSGTRFSAHHLDPRPSGFLRLRPSVVFNRRHVVTGLFAPLQVRYSGSLPSSVVFQGQVVEAGRPVTLSYKFNSYRLTYRYNILSSPGVTFGLGLTGKIRDASIKIEEAGRVLSKKNVGFVPLVNFYLGLRLHEELGFLLEGDALASSQGRAEDVFAGLTYQITNNFALKGGYRILEGGADNDEVYNFSLFHYASVGVIATF